MDMHQETIGLVSNLRSDSALLAEINEKLRVNAAIAQGMEDYKLGNVIPADDVIGDIKKRWQEHFTQ